MIDELNQRYERGDIATRFVPLARRTIAELEGTGAIPDACVDSVGRMIHALAARTSSGVLETQHGGEYLRHMWQRSDGLNRLLGGVLELEVRFALIELATFVCIEHSWIGCPPKGFAPLRPPWRTMIDAVASTGMTGDSRTQRWREIVSDIRDRPVEGARQILTCALTRSGMVDVERGELSDDDFAAAAGKGRRWFNQSHCAGVRLLGQTFRIKDRPSASSPVLGVPSANVSTNPTSRLGGAS